MLGTVSLLSLLNEMSNNLATQGAVKKKKSQASYNNLLLSSHEIISILEKNVYKQTGKKEISLQYLLVRGI